MAKFLIIGSNGMLAKSFLSSSDFTDNTAYSRQKLDITDLQSVKNIVKQDKPETIVNCAAYTNVTQAQKTPEPAYAVNAEGVKNIALTAKEYNIKVVHFSTDFVFKGRDGGNYIESEPTDPVNIYGKTKLQGELFLQEILPSVLIIRVSWLYGPNGKNFVSTISNLLKTKSELKIVADQLNKTTYTLDVVNGTKHLLQNNCSGIVHFAGSGVCSRYDFTCKIYEILKEANNLNCNILPIKGKDYPDPTPRPSNSSLNTELYTKLTGLQIPHWHQSLADFLSAFL